ncbi:MAG: septum formation initiator family protein [Lachnospiraceae bacterium]|nr:septum formation initiator family protein [Lachnospiraceae bacterium]
MKPAYKGRTKYHNRAAIYVVCLLVMVIAIVFAVNGNSLRIKKAEYQAQLDSLEEQYESEVAREEELEEYEKYTKTMKYYEEVAREKLGMVYEDEIIFKDSE